MLPQQIPFPSTVLDDLPPRAAVFALRMHDSAGEPYVSKTSNLKRRLTRLLGPAEPDQGWCSGALTFVIEQGESDGVDLGGRKVLWLVDFPKDFVSGNGTGRIYTVTYTASDGCDNSTSASVEVRVPHSGNASALAAAGLTPDGERFDPAGPLVAFVVTGASLAPAASEDLPGEVHPLGDIECDPPAPGTASRFVTLAEIGNGDGVLRARRINPLEADGDGVQDFLVTFGATAIRELDAESAEPIALHVVVDGTASFEVANVLGMGPLPTFPDEAQTYIDRLLEWEVEEWQGTPRASALPR